MQAQRHRMHVGEFRERMVMHRRKSMHAAWHVGGLTEKMAMPMRASKQRGEGCHSSPNALVTLARTLSMELGTELGGRTPRMAPAVAPPAKASCALRTSESANASKKTPACGAAGSPLADPNDVAREQP